MEHLRIVTRTWRNKSYNDEYFDRFYNQSAGTLIRQLSDAATDVGSYWFSLRGPMRGKPALPH